MKKEPWVLILFIYVSHPSHQTRHKSVKDSNLKCTPFPSWLREDFHQVGSSASIWFLWALCRVLHFPTPSPLNSHHPANCIIESGLDQSSQGSHPKSKPWKGHISHLWTHGRALRAGFESTLADLEGQASVISEQFSFPPPVPGTDILLIIFTAWVSNMTG